MSEAELDLRLLDKWCAHHRGESVDDPYFATLLMGVYDEGITTEVEVFLKRFSEFYGPSLFKKLIRIADGKPRTGPVEPWVHADLKAKRDLFVNDVDGQSIVKLIDSAKIEYADSHEQWHEVLMASESHSLVYDIAGDYASGHIHDQDLADLVEPLYHICNSYELVYSIVSELMQCPVDFGNYFEIYLRGADYAFGNDSILLIKHADVE